MGGVRHKGPLFIISIAAAILAGALYLIASVAPPVPARTPESTIPAEATSVVPAQSASPSEPLLSWSPSSTQVVLPRGQRTSQDFTFTSSVDLQNVSIEAVPEIAPFLTIQPTSFSSVSAGQPEAVRISFSIPPSMALGTYNGTIHLQVGTTTLPQTLKVTIVASNILTDSEAGFSVLFPPSLYDLTDSNSPPNSFDIESSPNGVAIGGAVPLGTSVATSGFAIGIDATPYSVSSTFDVTQYLASEYPNSAADASVTPITIGQQPGYEIFFHGEETGNWPVAVVYHNGYVYRVLYSSTDNIPGFSDQTGLEAFSSILANFTFSP